MKPPSLRLPFGTEVDWFETLDSTNSQARRIAAAGASVPRWIIAEEQTAGRGRQGRQWISGIADFTGTYLSAPPVAPSHAAQLSFCAALAVADVIDNLRPNTARLKWPNDVLVDGRKIAGILLESAASQEPSRPLWMAIGIGINLRSHPVDTQTPATSLTDKGITPPSLGDLLGTLAFALDGWLRRYFEDGFGPIREAWLQRGPKTGTPILVRSGQTQRKGQFMGLSAEGAAIIRTETGSLETIVAGDIVDQA